MAAGPEEERTGVDLIEPVHRQGVCVLGLSTGIENHQERWTLAQVLIFCKPF